MPYGCLCGGCDDCLYEQGAAIKSCTCDDGWHHDPEELKPSKKCKRCRGKGWVIAEEEDDG